MKEIKLMGKSYNLPTGWDEVSIAMMQQISELSTDQEDYIYTLNTMSIYSGIEMDILKSLNMKKVSELLPCFEFINSPIPTETVFKFTHNGYEYSVADNLLDQQFQDFVAVQTISVQFKNNKWYMIPYLLAVMAKRDGETLDSFDIRKRADEFNTLPVTIAVGISSFFLSNSKVLDFISLSSSPEVLQQLLQSKTQQLKDTLRILKNKRGKNLLIRLWIGISHVFIRSIVSAQEKYSNSPVLKSSKKSWIQRFKRLLSKKIEKEAK
jgi:hypothetical protein